MSTHFILLENENGSQRFLFASQLFAKSRIGEQTSEAQTIVRSECTSFLSPYVNNLLKDLARIRLYPGYNPSF
jgi:hypothetical protein